MIQAHIPQIIITVIFLFLLPVSKVVSRRVIMGWGKARMKNERRTAHVVRVANMLINFTFILAISVVWGVNPENILSTLSAVFAVIGVAMFAQWSLLSNITAGLLIFFTTPFKIGDEIEIKDKDMPIVADIEEIYTFHIHLRTREGELIVIPNNLFMQKIVAVEKNSEKL